MRAAKICPICEQTYTDPPALSREDNKTPICPECGTRQALEVLLISDEEKDEILNAVRSMRLGAEGGGA